MSEVSSRLRRARLAVFGTFFVAGFAVAVWVVGIPVIQERTGVSHGVLGGVLLVGGAGAIVGMQLSGWLSDRVGSRTSVIAGLGLVVVTVNLPGLATDAIALGAAMLGFGLANGALDVAMNNQAVIVQRAYGRPIMSAFHGFFSIGGAVGALAAAGALAAGWGIQAIFLAAAVCSLAIGAVCAPALLAGRTPVTDAVAPADGTKERIAGRALILGTLAFLLMLAEGVATDWSALQATQDLGQSAAAAGLAYGAFAAAMTLGRFLVDRVVAAVGPVPVVRYGSIISGVGLVVVIVSPLYPLTLLGWAVFGIGLAGIVPQIFTAAGDLSRANQGVIMSRVVGAGYLGMLAGPAIIGWIADATGLTLAFVVPVLCCVAGIFLAGSVSGRPRAAGGGGSPRRR